MMFILKKVVTPFLLPPGLLVLLLLGWGVWRLRCRSRAGALGAFGLALMIWVLSVAPTADLLMSGLEADFSVPKELHADAIIMLGGAAYRNVPDLSGKGAPGEGTMERLVTAARLYRRMGVPIIVSGGRVFAQAPRSLSWPNAFWSIWAFRQRTSCWRGIAATLMKTRC